MAEILKSLGLVDAEVHLSKFVFSDYRFRDLDEKLALARLLTVELPLETSASFINIGQFAVGHLEHDAISAKVLAPFRKVLMVRPWRECLASLMRFESKRIALDSQRFDTTAVQWMAEPTVQKRLAGFIRVFGPYHTNVALNMAGWVGRPDVMRLRFGDLIGQQGINTQRAAVNDIIRHLGIQTSQSVDAVLNACLDKPTLTYSGLHTDLSDYWGDEAETAFQELNGSAVDAVMLA